jgi:hypothetical protein
MRRAQRLGTDNEKVRLVNQCHARGKMVVGCLLDFTEGFFQPTVELDDEGLELAISQLEPGERERFLEGMLFFGIQDHHCILLQSQAIRHSDFEKYLNWWLIQKTKVLAEDAYVSLDNEMTKEVRGRVSGVRSVILRAPVTLEKRTAETKDSPKHQTLMGAVKSTIWDLLQTDGPFSEAAKAGEALALEDIELSVEIRRVGKAKHDGESLLDELAHTLRHAEDDVFEMDTSAGRIRGSDLRLAHQISVKTNNGVPEMADVAEKMHRYLQRLKDEGHIGDE